MNGDYMSKVNNVVKRTLRSGGFNYDRDAVSRETGLDVDELNFPSKTIQSGKDDADINVIVRRFGVTGQMPQQVRMPQYGDYTGISDFQSAMNVVRAAEEQFMTLPAAVRSRFGNDPQAFLEFCTNPDNIGELRKMGLANPVKDDKITPKAEDSPKPLKENRDERRVEKRAVGRDEASRRSEEDSGGE